MKKMLVTDYDNTFYTDEVTILKNINKVKEFKKNNNYFVIATARSWNSINKEIKKYNIDCDYIICNTGAVIMESKSEIPIYTYFLKADNVVRIENLLEKEENLEITRFTQNNEQVSINNILGYKIKGDNIKLNKIKEEIEKSNLDVEIIYKKENKLFINGKTKKEDAIEKVYKIINEPVDIITVGDDLVDIGMVKKYNGYRMKKSSEEMKKITDKEIESIYELLEINKYL